MQIKDKISSLFQSTMRELTAVRISLLTPECCQLQLGDSRPIGVIKPSYHGRFEFQQVLGRKGLNKVVHQRGCEPIIEVWL